MSMVKIAPADGRMVLMPEREYKPLPLGGALVKMSAHYARAVANGDARIVPANPEPEQPAAVEAAKAEDPVNKFRSRKALNNADKE